MLSKVLSIQLIRQCQLSSKVNVCKIDSSRENQRIHEGHPTKQKKKKYKAVDNRIKLVLDSYNPKHFAIPEKHRSQHFILK